jgi:glycosyltransferase involved in cell wall biosynthesis
MELKLSIIVPIYKVEQYLSKCVASLLNQDMTSDEYEIILVDDGSPDRCGEICKEYASHYSNVRVVHRENGGLSAARNSGIKVARGRYIQFVDSDDYLEPNVLRFLLEKMEADNLDVLRFNYQNVNEQYEVFEPNKVSKPFVDYSDVPCDGLTFLTERLGFGCYVWQFMIRRELLDGCQFKEGIYFEDTEWTPRLLLKSKRVTSTDLMVYNYLLRKGSITQSVEEKKKRKVLEDKLLLLDTIQNQMQVVSDKRWFKGMIAQTTLSVIGLVCECYYNERELILSSLKSRELFPLSTYHSTKVAKRKFFLANLSPGLLCWIMHLKSESI